MTTLLQVSGIIIIILGLLLSTTGIYGASLWISNPSSSLWVLCLILIVGGASSIFYVIKTYNLIAPNYNKGTERGNEDILDSDF